MKKEKKGILLVSFGTTYQDTREKNIEAIVCTVRERYKDCLVEQAYSSNMVRAIVKKREGIAFPDTKEALRNMKEQGVTHVTVLPTHIIDGLETHKIKEAAECVSGEFQALVFAGALLDREEDYGAVAEAFWESIKETAGERIVILMGHGSHHEADASYGTLQKALRDYAGKELYLATVEGGMTIEEVIQKLKQKETEEPEESRKKVLLTPFMLVAGDHARNDMAGSKDSFYTKLKEAGYEADCLLKGLGEYEKMRELYIAHLKRTERETD